MDNPNTHNTNTTNGINAALHAIKDTNHNVEPATDVLEERVIDAEYKIWKKNTPYLYDFVLTHSLEWPSLTCQWLPSVKTLTTTSTSSSSNAVTNGGNSGGGGDNNTDIIAEHSLLLGTHTTGEQNYLMVATCIIPQEEPVVPVPTNTTTTATATTNDKKDPSYEHTDKKSKVSTTTTTMTGMNDENQKNHVTNHNNNNSNKKTNTDIIKSVTSQPHPRYDDDKKEIGGYGHANTMVGKIEIKMKIKHEGEVNRARYMPQNHFIVATRGPSPEIFIWDISKHPSYPKENSPFAPQGVCLGHDEEGYAMLWSKHTTGHLLTGSEDHTVRLWDINAAISAPSGGSKGRYGGTEIKPVTTLSKKGHTNTVEDVDWHCKDDQMVISVGDDRRVCIWDLRDSNGPKHLIEDAHDSDINCVAFNPVSEYLFATGSADTTVAVWDIRNLKSRVHTLVSHTDQVFKVEWAPFNESILGSCSSDRRVALWDLSRIGQEQTPEDSEDGPPELLFVHGGHTSKVSDFSWNTVSPWTIASVSEDNVLQVWNIAEEIYANEDDGDGDDDEDDDDDDDNNKNKDADLAEKHGAGEDGMLGEDELED